MAMEKHMGLPIRTIDMMLPYKKRIEIARKTRRALRVTASRRWNGFRRVGRDDD